MTDQIQMTPPPEALETLMPCKHYARLRASDNGIWTHLDMAMERHCIRCGEKMVFVSVRDHSAMRAENEARLTEMQRVVCAALDEHETEVRRSLSRLAGKLGGAIDAVRKESP